LDEEEAVKIFDLVVKDGRLPASIDKLVPLSFIGAAAVKFYQAKVKLMDQLGMTEDQRKATLHDGQDAGLMLLDIEARIGELSLEVPQARKLEPKPGGARAVPTGEPTKAQKIGLPKRQMQDAQTIARHPEARAAVIAEAKKNEDIPTKTAVLNRIRYEKEKKRNANQKQKDKVDMTVDGIEYREKLMRVLDILPARPPKDLTEKDFKSIRGLVAIIYKRLEAFRDVQKQIE